nr:TetR/AcrR family transcriptional regulator [uncultured Anaerostipes sp.]
MHKQPNITDATREAFISAFFKLAQNKEIYQITIREITQLAGYNRTTFYRYFTDVYALIEYVEDRMIQKLLLSLRDKIKKHQFDDHFFQVFLDIFHDNYTYLSVLLNEHNRTKFIHRIQQELAHSSNIPIENTNLNTVIMNIYFSGIFSAIAAQIQNPNLISDDDLLSIIRDLFTKWYWPEVTSFSTPSSRIFSDNKDLLYVL